MNDKLNEIYGDLSKLKTEIEHKDNSKNQSQKDLTIKYFREFEDIKNNNLSGFSDFMYEKLDRSKERLNYRFEEQRQGLKSYYEGVFYGDQNTIDKTNQFLENMKITIDRHLEDTFNALIDRFKTSVRSSSERAEISNIVFQFLEDTKKNLIEDEGISKTILEIQNKLLPSISNK